MKPLPTHIKDLTPDPRNARLHNERNVGMISQSLEKVGAARSIVCDENGVIIAGHGVIEAAASVGIVTVRSIETTGNEIVAVVRRGLSDADKAYMGVADNRTGELSSWDHDTLKGLSEDGLVNLNAFWFKDELDPRLLEEAEPTPRTGPAKPEDDPTTKAHKFELVFEGIDDFESFKEMLEVASKRLKTTSPTDTIVAVMREATRK